MNKKIYCFFFCYLIIQVLSVVPEWDLSKAGQDLLGSNSEITIEVNHRYLYNVEMIMKKKLTKTDKDIKVTNLLKIAGEEKIVEYEQVESYYNLFNTYIVCPKGSYHPYNFTDNKEIKPDNNFSGENWDLRCYKHDRSGFFLVFYLMNGNKINMYLTNMEHINWYGGASIEKDYIKETYDFLLKDKINPQFSNYQMLAILNEENNIRLVNLAYTLDQGDKNQYAKSHARQGIIEKRSHTQAYFKNSTDENKYFYYLTYNDINDFKTGYSTTPINVKVDYYDIVNQTNIEKNDDPHFEFFDNMEIEKMEFLLYNKFIYYEMKSLNNSDTYYGIFDVKLNKIIFNTKEKITQFIPYNDMAMLAITKEKAYKVCAYNDNNNCIDTCPKDDDYLLDIEGNKCGQGCSDGKLTFIPLKVCIKECDEKYYVINDNKCGLCKDMNSTHPYKLIGGTECLDGKIDGSYIYNEKLKLLKCSEGYHLENNKCIKCYELCQNCTDSSNNETDQKCISCIDGFDLDENQNCICPSGKERKDKQCKECLNEYECGTYKINKCDCESCHDGYFLKDSRCKQCDSSCLKCETESTNCTECNNTISFLDNNKCYNCTKCKETMGNSCKCKSCEDGNYIDYYQCKKCENNCKTCSSATKCLSCEQFYSLENNECKKCSVIIPKCNSTEKDSCKCASCEQNYFLHENECYECNNETKCKSYEDNEKCKCKICNTGYYINNNKNFFCEKCSDICETCDGGIIDEMNHHCLSCKKDSENKYLINIDNKHICVSDCSLYNGTNNLEKNICEFKESKENPEKKESSVDYALIIVVCVIGVILIIISACICKKFICQKNETESIEEIEEGELIDK